MSEMRPPELFVVACLFSVAITPLKAQTLLGIPVPSAVAVDSQGAIYLAGYIMGAGLATTAGVFQPAIPPGGCAQSTGGCTHGFVARISSSGDRVEWATYLTGAATDSVTTLAVAGDGNVYVAGTTTSTTLLPGPSGNPLGASRLFVAKIGSDGTSLLAATYFGGSGTDSIRKLALDAAGNVYIAGTTASVDFPTTPGAYQRTLGASPPVAPDYCKGDTDGFLAKFDPALKSVLFSTLVGSPAAERTDDFAIGPDGSLYIAETILPERDSPCTAGLLTRLNPQGSAAVYSVFLGNAPGYALAVDSAGAAYLASDDRVYGVASPQGTVFKIDSQGKIVAMANLNGLVLSLTPGTAGIGVLGSSWPGMLTTTPGGPVVCYLPRHYYNSLVPYLARLDPSTLVPTYLGYLTSTGAWMTTAERVVAANPYDSLLPYAVLPIGPPAAGTITCIADAADYRSNAAAPGEIVSLFGIGIGPAVPALAQLDAHGNIGPELAGVEVLANGAPTPLLYAASSQINLVLPFGVTGDKVHLELYRNRSLVTQFDEMLIPQHPGTFTTGALLNGPLAALNQDGSVNSSANPAAPGSIVSIFATGLGVMTPQLPDGAVPAAPVNTPVLPIQVLVNQQPAEVLYIGNAPTLVEGVVQINLRLPDPMPMPFGAQPGQPYVGIGLPPFVGAGATTGGTVTVR